MVAFRRKPSIAAVTPPAADAHAPAAAPSPAAAEPAPEPKIEPAQDDERTALLRRIAELEQAEVFAASHAAQRQQIETHRQQWWQNNPLAREHYGELNRLHQEAIKSGHVDMSQSYIEFMEGELQTLGSEQGNGSRKLSPELELHNVSTLPTEGAHQLAEEMREQVVRDNAQQWQQRADAERAEEQRRTGIVSAPVSREAVSFSTGRPANLSQRIVLSPEQREMARLSMPDRPQKEAERIYAEQVLKLQHLKKDGHYQEQG